MTDFHDTPPRAPALEPAPAKSFQAATLLALPGTMLAAMHTLEAQHDFFRAQVVCDLLQTAV